MTYGVFDLLHYGHIKAIKKAKNLGKEVLIGVFSDKVAEGFKRKPILTETERLRNMIELNLGEVVLLDEYIPSKHFLDKNNISIVAKAEGAGWSKEEQPQWEGIKSVLLPYTAGISTSEIIKRVCQKS